MTVGERLLLRARRELARLKAAAGPLRALTDDFRQRREEQRRQAATGRERYTAHGLYAPAGHFYSPIPDLSDLERRASTLFDTSRAEVPGVDLREPQQLELLRQLEAYHADLPFGPGPRDGLRYGYENPSFRYADGFLLHAMLRHLRPKRIVEVGCGHSSCVILDTNERFLGGSAACTFVEPHPELFRALARPTDLERVRLIARPLEAVDLSVFTELEAGDVAFFDSTHVAKTGSDVNTIFGEILPRLRPGVVVHLHDIFHPFEYPIEWVREGRSWNELYVLRAFLQFNHAFEVLLFGHFLTERHPELFARSMPLCLKNPGGSLWLRRA